MPHKYARFNVTSAVLDLDAWTTDATTAAIVYRLAYAHGRTSDLTITGHTADTFDLIPIQYVNTLATAERREEMAR